MLKNLLTNKKKLTCIITAVILAIAIITTGTILIIKAVNNSNKTTTTTLTQKAQADSSKTQAISALKANNTTKAKQLFQEANQQYEAAGDTNNVVDTNAQLCLLGQKEYCHNTAN
jgi:sortase (surface protein transpeptidase)